MENGIKYDEEKLRYDLIPNEVLEQLAIILTHGAKKYKPNNWKFVEPKDRYYAAMMRHIEAYRKGYRKDSDSGEHHLSHALTCLMFLLYKEMNPVKQKIYIASPYTIGDKEENVRISLRAGDEVLKLGNIPVCPLLSHYWDKISPKDYEVWLDIDMAMLRDCDAVLRLPGESSGADKEVAEANKLGIPVYFGIEELKKAIESEVQ